MREHHERVFLDDQVLVRETLVELVAVLVNDAAKRDSDISERNDNVTTDARVFGRLEDLEEEMVVLITKL